MIDDVTSCPHGDRCGGCDHLGVSYGVQLVGKRDRLASALAPFPALAPLEVPATRGADPVVGYRTRIKWMAGKRGALGLFARGTHEVTDTPECRVAAPALADLGNALRALLRDPARVRVARSLRAVDLREVQGADGSAGALVTLVLVREERPARRELEAFAETLRTARPEVLSVWVNWAAKKAIQILGDETELVLGEPFTLDRQGDVLVAAPPGSFVQAHRGQAAALARALVQRVAALAGPSPERPLRVLELFAGAAPFGMALARAGCQVTAVEAYAPALEGAKRAAVEQGVELETIVGDAEAAVARLVRTETPFDVVVVDPPRRGLSPGLRRGIAALSPRLVAYVSCDPETLARDLDDLSWRGLGAEAVQPWDFVPLTEHVEAWAVLRPAPRRLLPVLAREGEALVVDAPPHLGKEEVVRRASAAQKRTLAAASPLPDGWSGAFALAKQPLAAGPARVVAAVRGSVGGRVRGLVGRLEVLARGPGRSLVAVDTDDAQGIVKAIAALGRAGHPPLGDARDAPTARHVLERHAVDRPLVHIAKLTLAGGAVAESPLAPDFQAALDGLGLAGKKPRPESGSRERDAREAPEAREAREE